MNTVALSRVATGEGSDGADPDCHALSARPTQLPSPGRSPRLVEAGHLVECLLRHLGEDPRREGLRRTPQRVVESLGFLTAGYQQGLAEVINDAVFAEECSEMIVVRDIEVYSLCEHHLLPFFGRAHVAYIPDCRRSGKSGHPW